MAIFESGRLLSPFSRHCCPAERKTRLTKTTIANPGAGEDLTGNQLAFVNEESEIGLSLDDSVLDSSNGVTTASKSGSNIRMARYALVSIPGMGFVSANLFPLAGPKMDRSGRPSRLRAAGEHIDQEIRRVNRDGHSTTAHCAMIERFNVLKLRTYVSPSVSIFPAASA
jgi:hypothetical protein